MKNADEGQTPSFADITTIHIGGRIRKFIQPRSRVDLISALIDADSTGQPLCVIGGGSNMLVSDSDFEGTVIRDARRSVSILDEATPAEPGKPKIVHVEAEAGVNWDDFVSYTVRMGLAGVEGLSGIPGTVGASVVQNIGAYGQEVATSVDSVQVWDRQDKKVRNFVGTDLSFGYRTSLLKKTMYRDQAEGTNQRIPSPYFPSPQYVVLSVTFALTHSQTGVVGMSQLAKALGVDLGERMGTQEIRNTVLSIRASKGMVEDPARYRNPWMRGTKMTENLGDSGSESEPDSALVHDQWSCGSFFVNPVIPAKLADSQLPADAPRFPAALPDGGAGIKTSAAWLIDHAGFHKGFTLNGRAAVSSRHTLALTNRGKASSKDMVELAQTIQEEVRKNFGIDLVPEPVFVGFSD